MAMIDNESALSTNAERRKKEEAARGTDQCACSVIHMSKAERYRSRLGVRSGQRVRLVRD